MRTSGRESRASNESGTSEGGVPSSVASSALPSSVGAGSQGYYHQSQFGNQQQHQQQQYQRRDTRTGSVISTSSTNQGANTTRSHTPTAREAALLRLNQAQHAQQVEEQRQQLMVKLQDIFERMTTAVLYEQPHDPLPFLQKFLEDYAEQLELKKRQKAALGL